MLGNIQFIEKGLDGFVDLNETIYFKEKEICYNRYNCVCEIEILHNVTKGKNGPTIIAKTDKN